MGTVVVKIRVPFWVPQIVGAVLYSGPKRNHSFDNHPNAHLMNYLYYCGGFLIIITV